MHMPSMEGVCKGFLASLGNDGTRPRALQMPVLCLQGACGDKAAGTVPAQASIPTDALQPAAAAGAQQQDQAVGAPAPLVLPPLGPTVPQQSFGQLGATTVAQPQSVPQQVRGE